jgi:hypothetical protein
VGLVEPLHEGPLPLHVLTLQLLLPHPKGVPHTITITTTTMIIIIIFIDDDDIYLTQNPMKSNASGIINVAHKIHIRVS